MTYQQLFDLACSEEHRQAFTDELDRQLRDAHRDWQTYSWGSAAHRAYKSRADKLRLVRDCLLSEGSISPLYGDCGAFVLALGAACRVLGISSVDRGAAAAQWDAEHGEEAA